MLLMITVMMMVGHRRNDRQKEQSLEVRREVTFKDGGNIGGHLWQEQAQVLHGSQGRNNILSGNDTKGRKGG